MHSWARGVRCAAHGRMRFGWSYGVGALAGWVQRSLFYLLIIETRWSFEDLLSSAEVLRLCSANELPIGTIHSRAGSQPTHSSEEAAIIRRGCICTFEG